MAKCEHCGVIFNPQKKYRDSEHIYCSVCRKYQKPCEICGKEIFVQARTCSKECAYELRKQSWIKSCGATHNFSKSSSSRKEWESRLLEIEGITNVFQREDVKEKIKYKLLKNYGVEHALQSPIILDTMRIKNEKKRLWTPIDKTDDLYMYRYNVSKVTNQNIQKYGVSHLGMDNKIKNLCNHNRARGEMITFDHKFSVQEGFLNDISPIIIGSIVNLRIMTQSENSSKGKKCSITLQTLMNDYNQFINNENKID